MQENEFEKQVQQKMEELRFHPSEPVWQKVALQIGKEKRKRRLLFFLLPLLLLTGGGLWYATSFYNSTPTISGNPSQPIKTTPPQGQIANNANKKVTKIPVQKNENVLESKISAEKQTASSADVKDQKGFETFSNTGVNNLTGIARKKKTDLLAAEEESAINEELHALVLQNEIEKRTTALAKEKTAIEKNVSKSFLDSAEKEKEQPNNLGVVAAQDVVDRAKQPQLATDTAKAVVAPVAEIQVAETAGKKTRNWEWTVTARAGASGLRNEVLNVFSNERADLAYASPSTGSGGTNNTPPAFAASSEIGKGLAWSVGAGVRKRMFRNAFVMGGLQYSRYSSRSAVGTQVTIDTLMNYNGRETSTRNYYRLSGAQSTYTTQYHYLELPLAFEYRLFKKRPLQIQHGISAGYLFSTNALYYDAASRVLYPNKHWLRKSSWHLLTSVDYRLVQTPAFSLFLGPQVQWSLSALQQPQESKKHFLFFSGIQSRITF